MSLLFVLGLWMVLGGSIYRAHKRSRSLPGHPAPSDSDVGRSGRRDRTQIPDTVPSEWAEEYRTEHGG